MSIAVRPARMDELPDIWALVRRTVFHMLSIGNPQWGEDYPTRALYEADIARGDLWAAVGDEGRILGVAALCCGDEPHYLPVTWSRPRPAAVMHRLAVDPAAQRLGVGSALFAQFEAYGRSLGVSSLRIDTFSLNYRMQALIKKQGFTQTGQVQFPRHTLPSPCYEKLLDYPV